MSWFFKLADVHPRDFPPALTRFSVFGRLLRFVWVRDLPYLGSALFATLVVVLITQILPDKNFLGAVLGLGQVGQPRETAGLVFIGDGVVLLADDVRH